MQPGHWVSATLRCHAGVFIAPLEPTAGLSDLGHVQSQGGAALHANLLFALRVLGSEQGKNYPAAWSPLPAGPLPDSSATSSGSSLASSAFVFGPGREKSIWLSFLFVRSPTSPGVLPGFNYFPVLFLAP